MCIVHNFAHMHAKLLPRNHKQKGRIILLVRVHAMKGVPHHRIADKEVSVLRLGRLSMLEQRRYG